MEPVTTTISAAIVKQAIGVARARLGTSLGPPFQSELTSVLSGVQEIKAWLEADRAALLQDAFSFVLQDDLDAARRSLTQVRSREPRSSVVRLWLALVLACQGRAGAAEEMHAALELNPFVVPPTLQALFTLRADPPVPAGLHWAVHLTGSGPGMTYASLGPGSGVLNPSRWAIGKLGKGLSAEWERRAFTEQYAWKGRHSSILSLSVGATDPVVHWMPQPFPALYAPTFLSRFDARTGRPSWHRFIPVQARLRAVTPSVVAVQEGSGDTCTLLSTATGEPTGTVPTSYFETLFHPPYAAASGLFTAAHAETQYRDLAVMDQSAAKRYQRVMPFEETLSVHDPFGQGLMARGANSWQGISSWYRHLRCTSHISVGPM